MTPPPGEPVPQFILDKPRLRTPEEEYFIEVFYTLSGSRNAGMGVGAIPLSEYMAYFQIYGIDDLQSRDDILYFCGQLDLEFLDHFERRANERRRKAERAVD